MKYIMCKYDEAYTKKEIKEECPIWCEKCTLECEYAKNCGAKMVEPQESEE